MTEPTRPPHDRLVETPNGALFVREIPGDDPPAVLMPDDQLIPLPPEPVDDGDRLAAIARLHDLVSRGGLSLEGFSAGLEQVLAANDQADLEAAMAALPSLVRLTPASRRLSQPLQAGRRHQSTRARCRVAVSRRNHRHLVDGESPTGSDHRQLGRPGDRPGSAHLDGKVHRRRPRGRRRAGGVSHRASEVGQSPPPGAGITRGPSHSRHLPGRRADQVRTPIPARQNALVAEAQPLRTVLPLRALTRPDRAARTNPTHE